jgi:hypothetical protein
MLSGFSRISVRCEAMAHIRVIVNVRERKMYINLCADRRGLVLLEFGSEATRNLNIDIA